MANKKVQVDILADTKNFHKGMSDAEKSTSKLHSALDRFGPVGKGAANILGKLGFSSLGAAGAFTAVTGAAGTAAAIIEKSVARYVELADQVRKYAVVTGQSAEASSRQVEAFQALGVSEEDAQNGMFKLAKAIESTPAKLSALGIEVVRNKDGNVDLNQTLLSVIDAYQGTEDAAKKAAIVYTAFGKAGQTMIPILETNSAQLKRLEDQAHKIFTDQDVAKVKEYQIAQKQLQQSWDDLALSIGQTFLPVQAAVIDGINENIYVNKRLDEADQNHDKTVQMGVTRQQALVKTYQDEYTDGLKAKAALDALTQAMKDNAAAAEQAEKAEQRMLDATNKNFQAEFTLEQAQIDLTDALKNYNAVGGKTAENGLRVREAYVKAAEAARDKAMAEAEANGVTLNANQQLQTEIDTLAALQKKLGPNDPLRQYLQGYINELKDLQQIGNINTNVGLTIAGKPGKGTVQHFAEGGMVGGSSAEHPVMARAGEMVLTPEQQSALGGRGGGGDIHLHIGTLIGADGPGMDRLAREILKRARFAPGT